MALPSAPFNAAKSIFAGRSIISITLGGGSPLIFESRLLNHKDDSKYEHVKRPDTTGVLRTVRTVRTEGGESFTFEVDEAKRIVTDLFTNALSGIVTGVCSLWLPDPADATGKVALESETGFAVTIYRDGDMKFGDAKVTTPSIMIVSNKQGQVTFTPDATVA